MKTFTSFLIHSPGSRIWHFMQFVFNGSRNTKCSWTSRALASFGPISPVSRYLQHRHITKTYLYNVDPLKSHLYRVKLFFFSYFCSKNIDCGHSLEPPRRLASTYTLCFVQKYEKYQNSYLKTFSSWWWNFQYIWIRVFSLCPVQLVLLCSILRTCRPTATILCGCTC